jgi:signal transduction histidine kinase
MEQLLKKQILKELEIVADLKEKNFQDLFDHNIEKLKLVSSRYQLKVELDKYNNNNNNLNNKNESQSINQIINSIKPEIKGFDDIIILDPSGKVIASTNNDYVGTIHTNDKFFIEGKKQNNASILFKDKDEKLKSYLTGPLIHNNKFLGVVTIIYDLEDFLSMLKAFEKLSSTGEIILAKRDNNSDALVINPLRFYPEASLNLTINKNQTPTPIIIQSLLNNENSFTDTVDYRGVPVLAVTRYIDKLDWGLVVKIDRTEALASLENLKYITILIGVLVGISIIIASLILGNSISNPIQKLRNVMKDVAKGKFDSKIDVKGTIEIEELAKQLDIMRFNISNTNTHLNELVKERTEKIEKSIVELKEKEEALKKSNRQLVLVNEKLNLQSKVQKEFINITAHELRTPIVPIITLCELLYTKIKKENEIQNTQSKENKKKEEFLQVILRNAYRLYQLTQDILDVTKIESQILKMNKEYIQLNEVIVSVVNDYKDNIIRKGHDNDKVRIVYEPIKEPIFVNADKARIIQVFSNLLGNALKFTTEGNIIISIKKIDEDQQVLVSIKDSGTGIDPEILPRLFTKFATKSDQGTGLGLFISKSIVNAHGGKIWAENNSDGIGATFYFILPISKSPDTNN